MKKTFNKPVLARYDIKLNENIAISFQYFQDHNQVSTTYHFSQLVPGDGGSTVFGTDKGCYDYVTNNTNNTEWSTSYYVSSGGLNLPGTINYWLSGLYKAAEDEYRIGSTSQPSVGYYYRRCFGNDIIE